MKINGAITILFNDDGATIEIKCMESGTIFARVKMTPEQTMQSLSRLMNTDCEVEVNHLDKVGKKMTVGSVVAEMPEGVSYNDRKSVAYELCKSKVGDGVHVDSHFGSKDSFFTKDGIEYCRGVTRVWE